MVHWDAKLIYSSSRAPSQSVWSSRVPGGVRDHVASFFLRHVLRQPSTTFYTREEVGGGILRAIRHVRWLLSIGRREGRRYNVNIICDGERSPRRREFFFNQYARASKPLDGTERNLELSTALKVAAKICRCPPGR